MNGEHKRYSVLLGGIGVAYFHERPRDRHLESLRQVIAHVEAVIGPTDDRHEVKDGSPAIQNIAKSVALICHQSRIPSRANGVFELLTEPSGLLTSEAFHNQVRVPGKPFSGFLVGPQLLLTSAHDIARVDELRVVFDFKLGPGDVARTTFTSNEVFQPTEVARRFDPVTREDWLLLSLDRSPPGRAPLTLADGEADLGSALVMFGHPHGLPMKYVDRATVTRAGVPVFECDLDATPGFSGAPVFDASSRVAGVLHGADPLGNVADGLWIWCTPGEGAGCVTFVTDSSTFADAVAGRA